MNFPYPKNIADWQTAYTRDDAFREYGRYSQRSELVMLLGAVFMTFFFTALAKYYLTTSFNVDLSKYRWYLKLGACLVLFILSVLVLSRVQSLAFRFANMFFKDFYRPPEAIDPDDIIRYRFFGKMKLPPPFSAASQFEYIMVKEGDYVKGDQWPVWAARNIGGPILLIVFDGCALYLERGNRFSRIVGPGDKTPFLEWYETIKYVVDLRPKIKTGNFDVWTKDGINIKITAQIECRIGDPKLNPPSSDLIYPYDPEAIKKAIERHALRWPKKAEGEPPEEFTWIDAAWGQVTGIVPGYISSRTLDDLLLESRKSGQILSPEALRELSGKLNNVTQSFGVYVMDFQVVEIKMPAEVEIHQKEFWKAEKQSISTLIDGNSKAATIRAREKVRAEAQYDLIMNIAEGLRKSPGGQFTEPLLLSLSGVLDESLREPLTRAYLAKETLDTLEQLQKIVRDNEPSEFGKLFNEDDVR